MVESDSQVTQEPYSTPDPRKALDADLDCRPETRWLTMPLLLVISHLMPCLSNRMLSYSERKMKEFSSSRLRCDDEVDEVKSMEIDSSRRGRRDEIDQSRDNRIITSQHIVYWLLEETRQMAAAEVFCCGTE